MSNETSSTALYTKYGDNYATYPTTYVNPLTDVVDLMGDQGLWSIQGDASLEAGD